MSPPEIAIACLACLSALLSLAALVRTRGAARGRRVQYRDEMASLACAYAEQMGGARDAKLTHALGAFARIDEADNKRRDYSDAEARIAIEAHLGRK